MTGKMLGKHLANCAFGRHCTCNPSPKEAKSKRRNVKRSERQAWKKEIWR